MARRKKKTAKAVARDTVTLNSVFTGIANAIRAKTGGSDPISPRNMGNAIRAIKNVSAASLPAANLPAVFQDIADAIRAIGGSGTMTPVQMPSLLQGLGGHPETRVKYTNNTTATFNISGELNYGDITDISNVTEVDIGNTVTSIGEWTFDSCSLLTTVDIPITVTSIGNFAFAYCSALSSVTIPNGVETIGDDVFEECTSLTSMSIPSTVTSIGEYAFYGCTGITSFSVDSNNQYYKSDSGFLLTKNGQTLLYGANVSTFTIPSGVTSIESCAFYDFGNITSLTIPNSVTTIGQSAFGNCEGLTEVTFGSGVTTIAKYAFGGCSSCLLFDFTSHSVVPTLQNADGFGTMNANAWIVVPDNLYSTWVAASNWSNSSIAPHIISATNYANIGNVPTETTFHFANGTSTTVNIQGELSTTVLENMGLKSNYQTWTNCPTRVEIGSGVTRLGHNAFQNGDALTEVTMPDSVLTMGDRVFQDCDHLTSVTLSNSLTEIGKESFKWSAITGMTVPSSVTTIGSNVFAVCNSLNAITFQGKTTTQVQGMTNYNFGLKSGCVVTCSNGTITI